MFRQSMLTLHLMHGKNRCKFLVSSSSDTGALHSCYPARQPHTSHGYFSHHSANLALNATFSVTAPRRLIGCAIFSLIPVRSEEHTSELQSQSNLVCRLLLEKKKKSEH